MEGDQKIKVTVSRSDKTIKEYEEGCDGSLSSLGDALRKIRSTTNDYLTELVNEEKSVNTNQTTKSKTKTPAEPAANDENDESDVELEEDFIDSQIKQELSTRHGSGGTNLNEKRARAQTKNNKRLKQ